MKYFKVEVLYCKETEVTIVFDVVGCVGYWLLTCQQLIQCSTDFSTFCLVSCECFERSDVNRMAAVQLASVPIALFCRM